MSLQSFHTYDFDNDPDYQEGVTSILQQIPGQLPEEDKKAMLLDAKCFYFSRKHNLNPPITSKDYVSYLSTTTTTTTTSSSLPTSAIPITTTPVLPPSLSPAASSISSPPPSSQPTYPPTFNELIDLITSNKPIPGIEEIPNTVIEDESLAAFEGTGGAPVNITNTIITNPTSALTTTTSMTTTGTESGGKPTNNDNDVSRRLMGTKRKKPWEKEEQPQMGVEEGEEGERGDVSSSKEDGSMVPVGESSQAQA